MSLYSNRPYVAALLTGFGYYLAGAFAVRFTIMPEGIAIMWPPNAFLLAAFLLSEKKYWWMYAIAGGAAEFAADIGSFPVWQIFGFAIVNLSETLFAAVLIGRLTGSHPLELSLKNLGISVGVILIAAPPLAALGGAQIYAMGDPSVSYWQFWRLWWFGDAIGLVVLLPAFLTWFGRQSYSYHMTKISSLEVVMIFGLGGSMCVLLFTPLYSDLPAVASPSLILLSLVWAAVRLGSRVATLYCLGVCVIAIIATTSGVGPFLAADNEAVNVLAVQEYLVTAALLTFSLSVAFHEIHKTKEEVETKNRFFSIVAHDLRTPFTTLLGMTQMMSLKGSEWKKTSL